MPDKYQRVFWANPHEVSVAIYRRKSDGIWRFKPVVGDDSNIPFIYCREAASFQTLYDGGGWHMSFHQALDELPLDTWFNYVEMDIYPRYLRQVQEKIEYEMGKLLAWMRDHISYTMNNPKQCKRSATREEAPLQFQWQPCENGIVEKLRKKPAPNPSPWLQKRIDSESTEDVNSIFAELVEIGHTTKLVSE